MLLKKKLFFSLCIGFSLLMSRPSPAAAIPWNVFGLKVFGGDTAGNGGGLAEQNFQFAFIKLPWIVKACLSSRRCVSGEEAILLKKIAESLPSELKANPSLIFESGAANPGRFNSPNAPRVAVTGDFVGSPIYLNLDLLYEFSSLGKMEAMDVGTAIGILIHELAHHQGIYRSQEEERFLDLLGAHVRAYAATEMEVYKTDTWGEIPERGPARIEMLVLHSDATALDSFYDGPQTSLLLSDSHSSFSLDASIHRLLHCPLKDGQSGKLLGYRFHGMRWAPWVYADSTSFRRLYVFHAPAFIQCLYPTDDAFGTFHTNLEVKLTLAFDEPKSGQANPNYEYVEDSLGLTLKSQ